MFVVRPPTVAAFAAVAAASVGGVYGTLKLVPPVRPPAQRIAEAVALLDAHPPALFNGASGRFEGESDRAARRHAARLALPLLGDEDISSPPPDAAFPGAAAYVLGAELAGRAETAAEWATAAAYMLRAERDGVPAERRALWAATAGVTLRNAGRPALALPLLREALKAPPGSLPAATPAIELLHTLADAALADGRTESLADAADRLAGLDLSTLPDSEAARVFVARGSISLRRRDRDAARAAVAALAARDALMPATRIAAAELGVRVALEDRNLPAARAALPPLPAFPTADDAETFALHALVAEAAGETAEAIEHHRTAARLAGAGSASLAAQLAEARLLTDAGRFEEAAAAFAEAVKPDKPTSRTPAGAGAAETLRSELRRACVAAGDADAAAHCAALCDVAVPVLGAAEARRLKAEALTAAADAAPSPDAQFAAAAALAAWAEVEPDAPRRRAARLAAADRFGDAGRPRAAVAQFDAVLKESSAADPGGVRLGRATALLDAGDAAAARSAAEELIRDRPTDPAVPAVRVLAGLAALEMGETKASVDVWTGVTVDSDLTPDAAEWRDALFSRAELAAAAALAAVPPVPELVGVNAPIPAEGDAADAALLSAADRLGECVARYAGDPRAARTHLTRGRCLLTREQRLAAAPPPADPLTARRRAERADRTLTAALTAFRTAEADLGERSESIAPSAADAARLQAARLAAAECLARLGRPDAGAVAVATAVDRDPLSPRSAAALLDLAAARRAAGDAVGGTLAVEQARTTAARLPDAAFQTGSPLSRGQWDRLFLLSRDGFSGSAAAVSPPAPIPARNAAP